MTSDMGLLVCGSGMVRRSPSGVFRKISFTKGTLSSGYSTRLPTASPPPSRQWTAERIVSAFPVCMDKARALISGTVENSRILIGRVGCSKVHQREDRHAIGFFSLPQPSNFLIHSCRLFLPLSHSIGARHKSGQMMKMIRQIISTKHERQGSHVIILECNMARDTPLMDEEVQTMGV